MSDESKDVNMDQVVTDNQDANIDQIVTGQDVVTDVVNQQATDQADASQEKTVPYDRFKEVNDAKKAAEEQVAYAQRQLDLMQAQTTQAQQTYVQPKSTSEQALDNCGLTADDLYGENIVKFQNEKDRLVNVQRQTDNATMAQQQFQVSHPDSVQVVGSVNPVTRQFIASPELLALLAKKPHLTGACNSVEIAYELVMQERQLNDLQKTQTITNEQQTRQTIDNKTQPMGGSAAGGMGGGSPQGNGLMSREQVREAIANLG